MYYRATYTRSLHSLHRSTSTYHTCIGSTLPFELCTLTSHNTPYSVCARVVPTTATATVCRAGVDTMSSPSRINGRDDPYDPYDPNRRLLASSANQNHSPVYPSSPLSSSPNQTGDPSYMYGINNNDTVNSPNGGSPATSAPSSPSIRKRSGKKKQYAMRMSAPTPGCNCYVLLPRSKVAVGSN